MNVGSWTFPDLLPQAQRLSSTESDRGGNERPNC
jgi:hypothetical protein